MSQLFCIRSPKYWSFSFSLQYKRLSRVFSNTVQKHQLFCAQLSFLFIYLFLFIYFFKFYFIFKLYNIVLVLPNIEMNPPQVNPRSPSWTLLPPPSPTLPLGRPSAPAPSIQYCASNLDWWLVSYMIFYMFQCHSPKSSHPLPLPQSPKHWCMEQSSCF